MAKVKIVDQSKLFQKKLEKRVDTLLSALGVDILRLSKQKVPVDKGQLQSSALLDKIGEARYRIVYNKEYAGYQHRGSERDGSRVVRNYTTSGTGKKYLEEPAKSIMGNIKHYLDTYL